MLKNVQILTTLRCTRDGHLPNAHLGQDVPGHLQRVQRAGERPVAGVRRWPMRPLLLLLVVESDLLQDADQQLVHVVLDPCRRFNKLRLKRLGKFFAFCGKKMDLIRQCTSLCESSLRQGAHTTTTHHVTRVWHI